MKSLLAAGFTPEVLNDLKAVREEFIASRAVWIPGHRMKDICRAFGATEEDLDSISTVSDTLKADPTFPFRHTRNGRFLLDFDHEQVRRLEFQPYLLSVEEDFVRFDSGTTREFDQVQDTVQRNSVLRALLLFQAFMFDGIQHKHRPNLDYGIRNWICTLFQTRTITRPGLVGEPALEGVHSDGVDLTMTTLLRHSNMTDESAVTFMHTQDEVNGTRWNEADPKYLLGKVQHKAFLDTLIIFDHERKHSVSPVWAIDKSIPAVRDMLIFFTRKPVLSRHPSYRYDSLNDHEELRLNISM